MQKRVYNFSAGPALLPESVLKKAQSALWSLGDSGIGILEHSHRGTAFTEILANAEANIRKLVGMSDEYRVLFLHGGASTQFFMVPMNLLGKNQSADYINTGIWSQKAIKEAKRFGSVHIAASSEDKKFTYIPQEASYSEHPRYVHFTSNNTIAGTEFSRDPTPPANVPLVCDASSHIFSRPIRIANYGLLYAGAQKNLGPSGLCIVMIRKDLLADGRDDLPTMCRYQTHADHASRFNTPPTFPIYIVGEVIKELLDLGGLAAVAEHNRAKAKKLYDYLDSSKVFRSPVHPDSRSTMNVVFRGPSEEREKQFLAQAHAAGLVGLQGHRSVGGMRASIYNAFPAQGVDELLSFMADFEAKMS